MMSPRFTSRVGQQVLGDRAGGREGQLVDQQVVADQQRVFHRPRGDDEGLHQGGGAEQQQDDGDCPFGDEASLRRLKTRAPRARGAVSSATVTSR